MTPKHWLVFFSFSTLAIIALLPDSDAAQVHQHKFVVQSTTVKRLCKTHSIITVNGQFPGPTIEINEGDTLVVDVVNRADYNVTIHWHGIRQFRTGWADGPEMVTQCPIRPGGAYRYRFTVSGQEGTLWWHAHSSWLRATVYGALIIRPNANSSYPLHVQPDREVPLILGEWWNKNPVDVLRASQITGAPPDISDAFTINAQPGDLYDCSTDGTTTKIPVKAGETALFRFINAALNSELFVAIAGHEMTVVATDASYTKPFTTDVLMIAPGQTTDVLVSMNQAPARYYIAARAYSSAQGAPFDNTTATAIVEYDCGCDSSNIHPAFPALPAFNDTAAATAFAAGLRSPRKVKIPGPVDESLFVAFGLGLISCAPGANCAGPNNTRFAASMNNVSFQFPSSTSLLQAYKNSIPGVFTADFPSSPPIEFDYTADNISGSLLQPIQATKLYKLRFKSVVQLVLQGTNIVAGENHPIHIHGYDFYVLARGFGNYDEKKAEAKFNLVDPPVRNTVAVPVNGWAVVRFVADNPGVWLMHCHLDAHISTGLAMAFIVEDGAGELQALGPAPADLPAC